MRNLLKQKAHDLECQIAASKGGNIPGITEDHRFELLKYLHAIRSALAQSQPA